MSEHKAAARLRDLDPRGESPNSHDMAQSRDIPLSTGKQRVPIVPGQVFARRYLIESLIDGGGMGHVYLARQQPLGRRVALKVLSESQMRDPAATARFHREARALSKLQHPNIVNFIDHGQEGEHHFIVMEHVEGYTLRQSLDRSGPMSLDAFLPVAIQLLDGVGAAHAREIIHRDLKPDNVMLCPRRGQAELVKLLDFGLARSISSEDEVTRQGLMGSVLYLAPERITGGPLTPRADVYSLGVLFYHMLTGCYPIAGESDFDILMSHVKATPVPLRDVLPVNHNLPAELIHLIEVALSKRQEQRPKDANELLEAMVRISREHRLDTGLAQIPTPHPPQPSFWSQQGEGAQAMRRSFYELPTAMLENSGTGQHPALMPSSAIASTPSGNIVTLLPQAPAQVPQQGRTMLLMVAAFLFTSMLGVLALIGYQSGVFTSAESVRQNNAEATMEILDQADGLISEGRYGEAEFLVRSISQKAQRRPELLVRLASVQQHLEVGQTLTNARSYEVHGEYGLARDAYERVLRRDPSNERAQEGLRKLRVLEDEQRQAEKARLEALPPEQEATLKQNSKKRRH